MLHGALSLKPTTVYQNQLFYDRSLFQEQQS
nr:MAG TPA: hypothetical protein [Caudoviricetes sp.]